MAEPPLKGWFQVIVTETFDITVVTGDAGVFGLVAALIEISDESTL